jgi:hypothetical protein
MYIILAVLLAIGFIGSISLLIGLRRKRRARVVERRAPTIDAHYIDACREVDQLAPASLPVTPWRMDGAWWRKAGPDEIHRDQAGNEIGVSGTIERVTKC